MNTSTSTFSTQLQLIHKEMKLDAANTYKDITNAELIARFNKYKEEAGYIYPKLLVEIESRGLLHLIDYESYNKHLNCFLKFYKMF